MSYAFHYATDLKTALEGQTSIEDIMEAIKSGEIRDDVIRTAWQEMEHHWTEFWRVTRGINKLIEAAEAREAAEQAADVAAWNAKYAPKLPKAAGSNVYPIR